MLKNIWLWWKESGGFHQISLTLELLEGFQWSHYTDLWEKVHTKAENRSSHSPKYNESKFTGNVESPFVKFNTFYKYIWRALNANLPPSIVRWFSISACNQLHIIKPECWIIHSFHWCLLLAQYMPGILFATEIVINKM